MKRTQSTILLWSLVAALVFFPRLGPGQDAPETPEMEIETDPEAIKVDLEGVLFQQVLDQLFGTPETAGLLSGEQPFVFHAEDIVLTPEEFESFFGSDPASTTSFAALVAGFEEMRGGNVMIEGSVEGSPFEFKIAGRQLKLEGINLTQAELDALVASLQSLPGLHEAKIEATVDGQPVDIHLQNRAGNLRIEDRVRHEEDDTEVEDSPERENRGRGSEQHEQAEMRRHDLEHRADRSERIERTEARPDHGPERVERVEMTEHPDRIERPEMDSPARGRH
jgi:hypothetical protein